MKEHEIVNDPSEIILPHEQYQQKTQFFIDVFHEPFGLRGEGWRKNQDGGRPKCLQKYDKEMDMGKHTVVLTINIYS